MLLFQYSIKLYYNTQKFCIEIVLHVFLITGLITLQTTSYIAYPIQTELQMEKNVATLLELRI